MNSFQENAFNGLKDLHTHEYIGDDTVKVRTTCLLPDWETLYVYIKNTADGVVVSDMGEVEGSIFLSGKEIDSNIEKLIKAECKSNGIEFVDGMIQTTIKDGNPDSISSAVLAVANSSVHAGRIGRMN